MKSIKPPAFLLTFLYILLALEPLPAKDKKPFISEIRGHIESDLSLSQSLDEIKDRFGSPVWSQAFEKSFDQVKIAFAPLIDYKNDHTSGIIIFLELPNGKINYEFISRAHLLKQFIDKKKSKRISYRNTLIASFLKFDLKLYNLIEQEFTDAIDLTRGNKAQKIEEYEIGKDITALFDQ